MGIYNYNNKVGYTNEDLCNINISGGNIYVSSENKSYGVYSDKLSSLTDFPTPIIVVSENAKITSKSNSTDKGAYGIRNTLPIGSITIKGGTIEAYSPSSNAYGICLDSSTNSTTTLDISDNAKIFSKSDSTAAYGIYNEVSTEDITISGGMIEAYSASNKAGACIDNRTSANISFTGGELRSNINGISNRSSGNVEISNATIIVEGEGYIQGINNTLTGDITMNSGIIKVSGSSTGGARGIWTKYGTVTFNDGNIITRGIGNATSAGIVNQCYGENAKATINIFGGTIECISDDNYAYGICTTTGDSSNLNTDINISGNITIKSFSISNNSRGIFDSLSTGTMNISGGTIIGESQTGTSYGVYKSKGTLILGNNDSTISTTSPSITGGKNGVYVASTGTFNFYDGIIKGGLYTSTNKGAIDAKIENKPDGYGLYYLTKDNSEVLTLKEGLILNYDVQVADKTKATWYNRSENLYNENNELIHGKLLSEDTPTAFGWTDNGLVFDGTDDWVNTGIEDTTEKSVRSFVATFKVPKTTELTHNIDIIGNWEQGGGGLYINKSGKLVAEFYLDGYKNVVSEMVLNPNQIYKAVAVYDGNQIKLYINNQIAADPLNYTSVIGIPQMNTETQKNTVIGLGANPYGTTPYLNSIFNGTIYSAYVFDKALTKEEVKELYNSEKAKGR